jgi:hypothetical protein
MYFIGKFVSMKTILKNYFFFLLSAVLFYSCSNGNTAFYNTVLNDFDSSSYYVALNIKSPDYKGRVIIENDDLYKYLNKTKGLDKIRYHSMMQKILTHRRYLKVDDKDLLGWKFIEVPQVNSVIFSANKGVNSFIAQYFNGVVLNAGLSYDEIHAVINQLFYWGIPIRVDPVSHQLLLDN